MYLKAILVHVSVAQLKRVLVIRVYPEDRCVLLSMSSSICDYELSLSHPLKIMEDNTGLTTITIKQLIYL